MAARILICMGTSGISAGAREVVEVFKKEISRHNLSDSFKIIKTGDRGLFRDVLVDIITPELGRLTYEYIKPKDVPTIVENHLVKGEPVNALLAGSDYKQFFAKQMRIVLVNCGEIDPEDMNDYVAHGGYMALKKAFDMTPEHVIEEVKNSGLRGRGGAGFPTGRKWELARASKGNEKYLICNADEGDPGAFMDRSILEGDPQAVIEGMIIAAHAIGMTHGFIYCREEYPLARERLNIAIAQAREKGFLGKNILDSKLSFNITIKRGAGAFVCGEETAMIASIEGHRGMPRHRPPFPVEKGLWGKPTVINNVETLANISHIINKGWEWFSSIGTQDSKGTKVFALAGKVKNTGLVEVPMGTPIRDLIYGAGSGMLNKKVALKAVQIGGPSGGCIPASLFDTPIDYGAITQTGAIMGSGGFVVMDEKTCMVDIARYFLSFTVSESCGKCLPCRVGLKRLQEVLEEIAEGRGKEEHIKFLKEMSTRIKESALCGLGTSAPNPALTTLRYFMDEYLAHIRDRQCPAHVCTPLVKFVVVEQNCTKCGQCHKVCPSSAIIWQKKEHARIDKDKCIKCKACIDACDFKAIA
jgi:NADH-quinone oxidoreductase subunit F